MNINAKVTLGIRDFFKRYGKVILVIFLIWLALFLGNQYVKHNPKEPELQKSYKPNEPVMDNGEDIPKKEVSKVNSTIDEYFNYCNSKEYDKAFNMITDDCKSHSYNNDINRFKEYVDLIYKNKKIYNLQNYSNTKNTYIYNMRIIDDVTATGTTNDYEAYEEKITVHNVNGNMMISNQGYIGKTQIGKETEDDNMKIKVISKDASYQREEYLLAIRNKSDNYIMISDEIGSNQVILNLGSQSRSALNTVNTGLVLLPGETRNVTLLFDKYFDSSLSAESIDFNDIRILTEFTTTQVDDSEKLRSYSLKINLK